MVLTAAGIIACEHSLGRYRYIGATPENPHPVPPDQYWTAEDIPRCKWFTVGHQFYLYIPRREGPGNTRRHGVFVVYENQPVGGVSEGDDRFNPVLLGQRGFTKPPYVEPLPKRSVEITRNDNTIVLRVVVQTQQERILTQADVGRTALVRRLLVGAEPGADTSKLSWQELNITAVNEGTQTATCTSITPLDVEGYQYPETTHMWFISAFTNSVTGLGRLDKDESCGPDGFCVQGSRLWCYKGSDLFGSATGKDPLNFEYSPYPETAITRECKETSILWLVADKVLVVGTPIGIYAIYSSATRTAAGIIDRDIELRRISFYGSAPIPPISLSDGVLFVANNQRAVCRGQLTEQGAYAVQPVLSHLQDIMGDAVITGGDSQFIPHRIIWLFLNDSRFVSLVMTNAEPELRIGGVHDLGGGILTQQSYGEAQVLEGVVSREGDKELLVMHVRRTRAGLPVHSLEFLDLGSYTDSELEEMDYLDCKVSVSKEELIQDMKEADICSMEIMGPEGAPPLPEGLDVWGVGQYGRLKVHFRDVPGFEGRNADVMYDPMNLQYQNLTTTGFNVLWNGTRNNEESAPTERRGTPVARQWGIFDGSWTPLYSSSLKLDSMTNVEGVPDVAYPVLVTFRVGTELTQAQLDALPYMLWSFHNIGNISTTPVAAGLSNKLYRLVQAHGMVLLADTYGDLISMQLQQGAAITGQIRAAEVYVGCTDRGYRCRVDEQSEGFIVPTKNWHRSDWEAEDVRFAGFRFHTVPGLEAYNRQRVLLIADKSVDPVPGRFFMRRWPEAFLSPIERVDIDTVEELDDKRAFFQRIQFMPLSERGGTYAARYAPEIKRGAGHWRLMSIPKDMFKTLIGMDVRVCINNVPTLTELTLSDDKFTPNLLSGELEYKLEGARQVFVITFGYLYRFEMQPSSAVVPDPTVGSTEWMVTKVRECVLKLYKSRDGNCSPSADPRDVDYKLKYSNTFDETLGDGLVVTAALRLPVDKAVNPVTYTTHISQESPANIAVMNVVQDLEFSRR
jgi:hypothetical protein